MRALQHGKAVLLLLVIGIFLALQLRNVLVLGKGGDGLEYAAISRNLAEGVGSLWAPSLDELDWAVHREEPPLFYALQAGFFLVLGDTPYMEGIFGVTVGLVILGLVAALWRTVRRDLDLPGLGSWWPVLLTLVIPVLNSMCQSNMMSFTLLVFVLLSVLLGYRSIVGPGSTTAFAAAAGLAIFLGFHVKGPVALFALVLPLCGAFTLGVEPRRAALSTLVTTLAFSALFGATLLAFPGARALWADVLENQVLASVAGERGVVAGSSRWAFFVEPLRELSVPVLIVAALALTSRGHRCAPRLDRPPWWRCVATR